MCHQSVGLIARAIEARGIATISLSSAYSITAAVQPPRAAYVDYPLGHTAGKPFDAAGQRRIVLQALKTLESAQVPGTFVDLQEQWSADHAWKDKVMQPSPDSDDRHEDDRQERLPTPQYQTPQDAAAAANGDCPSCIWLAAAAKSNR